MRDRILNRQAVMPLIGPVTLYAFGVLYWFNSFGLITSDGFRLSPSVEFGYLDWPRNVAVHEVIGDAISRFEIPYVSSMIHLRTDLLLSIPEIPVTPQLVLLGFVSVDQYMVANTLLMYSIGFFGLRMFASKFGLGAVEFALLYLMFMMNGHVISHLSVGHTMWVSYYLLPFLMIAVFGSVNNAVRPKTYTLLIGLSCGGMLLQGGLHIYVLSGAFLLVVAAVNGTMILRTVNGIALSFAVGAVKIIPALIYFDFSPLERFSGYSSPYTAAQSLVLIRDFSAPKIDGLKWWEFDAFVGFSGATVIAVVLIAKLTRSRQGLTDIRRHVIAIGAIVMLVLSIGPVSGIIYEINLPIDINKTERVPSRYLLMFLVPTVFLVAIHLRRLTMRRPNVTPLVWIVIASLTVELLMHARAWRLTTIESKIHGANERTAGEVALATQNLGYQITVQLSLAVTVIATLVVIYLLLRSKSGNLSYFRCFRSQSNSWQDSR